MYKKVHKQAICANAMTELEQKIQLPDPEKQKKLFETLTIPGNLLASLSNGRSLGDTLVFGCGTSNLPSTIREHNPNTPNIVAYDHDPEKIAKCKKLYKDNKVLYIDKKIPILYNTIIAHAVLHENPNAISKEINSMLSKGGHLGIIDYDMKGMKMDEFLIRWTGFEEKEELKRLGNEACYRMHTKFGLDDCIKLLEKKGITQFLSHGKLPTMINPEESTKWFFYHGIKKIDTKIASR